MGDSGLVGLAWEVVKVERETVQVVRGVLRGVRERVKVVRGMVGVVREKVRVVREMVQVVKGRVKVVRGMEGEEGLVMVAGVVVLGLVAMGLAEMGCGVWIESQELHHHEKDKDSGQVMQIEVKRGKGLGGNLG